MAEIKKASILAVVEQTNAGELVSPTLGTQFIPLREGFSVSNSFEELNSDELLNDLGAAKASLGKESTAVTHPIYLKHSNTEGVPPNYYLLLKSALGGASTAAAEYDTVSSTTTSVTVGAGEGATYQVGEAVLIKDPTSNKYKIRNIDSIATDTLGLNFNIPSCGAGVNLGKATVIYPLNTGHSFLSLWYYFANGGAVQAVEDCRTNSVSINLTSGQFATADIGLQGSKAWWNPVEVKATNKYIDFKDDSGIQAAILTEGFYSQIDFASHVQDTIDSTSTANTLTAAYSSSTGKYTVASNGSTFELLWNTGANTANAAAALLGFSTASDNTAAVTYTGSASSYAAALTPEYDNANNVVVKSAELLVGDASDTVCRAAGAVTFNIEPSLADVDSVCAESGVMEKLPSERSVTMTATLILAKHEANLYDKFVKNTSTKVMMNIGPKINGNYVAGKCVNIYMGNATITAHPVDAGGQFLVVTLACKGFVDTAKKDIYINFI
jgi:hypothetical protein